MEIWKDVVGYEGLYKVSNLGQVRSLDREVKIKGNNTKIKPGRILKPYLIYGYPVVILYDKNSRPKKGKVHRLVAIAFISNPENKPEVNHIDGIKTNSCINNLEWVTGNENKAHAVRLGLNKSPKGECSGMSKLTDDIVKEAKILYATGNFTFMVLGLKYNVSAHTISDAVKGRSWKHLLEVNN